MYHLSFFNLLQSSIATQVFVILSDMIFTHIDRTNVAVLSGLNNKQ